MRILPLLLVGFATYQLDRTNISSALTAGLATAISVNQDTINLGNQLMFLGVIILEIPSNVILHMVNIPGLFVAKLANEDRLALGGGLVVRFLSLAWLLPYKFLFGTRPDFL